MTEQNKDKAIRELQKQLSEAKNQLSQAVDLLEVERAKQRLPKNMDFVQVQRSELRSLTELSKKGPLAFELLMLFSQSMNKQNAVMMSYETMASLTGKSRSSLDRAIRTLKKDNWVQVIKVGTANAYVVNSAVFWTDKGDKKYTSFTAQIVTTMDEQEKDVRSNPNVKLKRVPILESDERVVLDNEELPPPDQQDLNLN